jgi:hypothetical protein
VLLGLARHRGIAAIACLVAFVCQLAPTRALASDDDQSQQQLALILMSKQTCAQRLAQTEVAQVTPPPSPPPTQEPAPDASPSDQTSPAASPTPFNTPGPPGVVRNDTYQLYATPRPQPGTSTGPALPAVPTPTPNPYSSTVPIFLQRSGETPPPITPAGHQPPSPTPQPTGVPTLAPGHIAVIADEVTGGAFRGQPSDAIGNVHIYYQEEEIVGQKAHFDGNRTVTITGHPFLINHRRDSVFNADEIVFDTVSQTAKLIGGAGETAEGVEIGFLHFKADDLHTDPDGEAHGKNPYITTCENPRSGYHITGKQIDVVPGDKIIITKAVLWLGAAAVFYLPRLVIPLRSVDDQRAKPQFFPEVGYDSYEGAWIKMRLGFGKDRYYYGYYIVNYFTKEGLGLGYVAFYASKKGRRTVSVNVYAINDHLQGTREYNLALQEQENFSQRVRGNFNFSYQSNYGPLTQIPPNESLSGAIVHQGTDASQNYSFSRSSVGSQSSSNSFAFVDTRQINQQLSQTTSFTDSESQANYGGEETFSSTVTVDSLTHYTTAGADYQLEYDKTYTQQPTGIDKIPELQVRPYDFFQHFIFPLSAQLTVGEYSEPSDAFATWRTDAGFVVGPALAKVFGSDFQATVNVDQYAYGTGDLKAAIQQTMSLTTPLGNHIVNAITYNEANYNGPAFVPFQYLDQQPTTNTKNAQDLVRFFNDDIYTLSLGYSTNFDGVDQPLSYQLSARPSPRSVLLVGGSLVPGEGFPTTNVQVSSPFGRDSQIQFITDVDWRGPGEKLQNKVIYYSHVIGGCYEVQVLYNEDSRLVSASLNLLAFPSQAATFGIGQSGPIVPSTFNF